MKHKEKQINTKRKREKKNRNYVEESVRIKIELDNYLPLGMEGRDNM